MHHPPSTDFASTESATAIPKSLDVAMDAETSNTEPLPEGISIRGPDMMDLDAPVTNGTSTGKRKSRGSIPKSYKEASGDESEEAVASAVSWRYLILPPCVSTLQLDLLILQTLEQEAQGVQKGRFGLR